MLSVILPVFGSKKQVESILNDLEQQIVPFAFEVIVILDKKKLFLKNIIQEKEHPYINFKWDFSDVKSICRAINIGVKHSAFEYVYIINENFKINSLNHIQQVYNFIEKTKNISGFGGLLETKNSKLFSNMFCQYWNRKILERKLTSGYTTYLYLLNSCFRKETLMGNMLTESAPFLSSSFVFFSSMLKNQQFFMIKDFMTLGLQSHFTFFDYIKISVSEGFEFHQCLKSLYENMPSHTNYYKVKENKRFLFSKEYFLSYILVDYGKYLFSVANKKRNLYLSFLFYLGNKALYFIKKTIKHSFLKEAYFNSQKVKIKGPNFSR